MDLFNNKTISFAARYICIDRIGRTKIYIILRALGIVNESNKPLQVYIDKEYLTISKWCYVKNGRVSHITYAVGYKGMDFIRKAVLFYLKDHDIPKVERKPKNCYSI